MKIILTYEGKVNLLWNMELLKERGYFKKLAPKDRKKYNQMLNKLALEIYGEMKR